ncbi:MAG: hypothetical protein IKQ40_00710 [Lachnospiraceae bacterium]|nr:hypothetical protein [Lachnospiraceae bacterium]
MTVNQYEWTQARDELVNSIKQLGFPEELGREVAKNLGSPKAMRRMNSYLYHVKPRRVELVVDEMLAIKSEIEAWRDKKASREANEKYNQILYEHWD